MQAAIVKSTSSKEGDNEHGHWKNTLITCADGAKVGTLDDVGQLNQGDEFEFEPEIKGKYVNIKKGTFKLLKANPNPGIVESAEKGQQGKGNYQPRNSEAELKAKARNTALMQAVDWTKFVVEYKALPDPIKITDGDILAVADRFYNWLVGDTKPAQTPSSTPTKQQPDSPEGKPPTSSSEKKVEATELLKEALQCKDGAALGAFAGKHGISLEKFVKLVGCNPIQVKDVPAAAKVLFKEV